MDRAVVRNLVVGFVLASSIYLLGCGGSSRNLGATSSQNAQGTTTPAASTAPSSSTSTDSSSGSSASGSSASGSSASGSAASGSTPLSPVASAPSSSTLFAPSARHIFVMSEENTSYGSVVGNTSQMPFINGLIAKGTLWTNFYANQHGSMHAYIETMSGTAFTCSGNDCGASGALTGPSLMDLMNASKLAWKGYFDGLSSCGQLAPQSSNWILNPDSNGKQNYYQRHTPYPWYAVGNGNHRNLQEWRERLVADEPVHNGLGQPLRRVHELDYAGWNQRRARRQSGANGCLHGRSG